MVLEKKSREVDYYLSVIKNPQVRQYIRKAERVVVSQERKGGHSFSWVAEFKPFDKKFFCKKVIPIFGREDTFTYRSTHDPNALFSKNIRNTDIIYHNVSKKSIGGLGGPLVARLLDHNDPAFILFFEYLDGQTDRDRLIEIAKKGQESEKEKKDFLYEVAKKIARFDGLVHAYNKAFPEVGESLDIRKESWSAILIDNLLTILNYNKNSGKDDSQTLEEIKKDLLQKNINIEQEVNALADLRGSLEEKLRLQHGDCRVHHVIGNRFVDLELFSRSYQGRDLVTYCSAEGKIAQPTAEEFPRLLACYLAYEAAYGLRQFEERERKIIELNKLNKEEMAGKIRDVQQYADFMVNILARTIEENLHLDGSNKRYSREHLKTFIKDIPNYSIEDSEKARLTYTGELFELVANDRAIISLCTNPQGVREYFYSLGCLLDKLDLIKLGSNLNKLKNGSIIKSQPLTTS